MLSGIPDSLCQGFPDNDVSLLCLPHSGAVLYLAARAVSEPSRADEALTQALKQALALVDVKVLDHFVVGGGSAMSFAECGRL